MWESLAPAPGKDPNTNHGVEVSSVVYFGQPNKTLAYDTNTNKWFKIVDLNCDDHESIKLLKSQSKLYALVAEEDFYRYDSKSNSWSKVTAIPLLKFIATISENKRR